MGSAGVARRSPPPSASARQRWGMGMREGGMETLPRGWASKGEERSVTPSRGRFLRREGGEVSELWRKCDSVNEEQRAWRLSVATDTAPTSEEDAAVAFQNAAQSARRYQVQMQVAIVPRLLF